MARLQGKLVLAGIQFYSDDANEIRGMKRNEELARYHAITQSTHHRDIGSCLSNENVVSEKTKISG